MMNIKNFTTYLKEKLLNKRIAVIILITGAFLMCLPAGTSKKAENTEDTPSLNAEAYTKELEKRLSIILSSIDGVSDVSVMITLKDSGIYTHEHEKSSEASKNNSSLSLKSQGSGKEEPVIIKKSYPTALGVIVTAKGAGNAQKHAQILSAVKAVLNVSSHRVTVLPK